MSGAGSHEDLHDVDLTFDSAASRSLPHDDVIRSGIYRPTNYTPTVTFASPAPGQPYGSSLTSYNNSDPNGYWSLYVMDRTGHVGDHETPLADGWSLTISINPAP